LLQNAVSSGEVQLLRKPFGADTLVRKVRAALDRPSASRRV